LGAFYFLKSRHLLFPEPGHASPAGMAMRTELKLFEKYAFPLLLLAFVLLLRCSCRTFGMRINGARRWLNLLVTTSSRWKRSSSSW
jgi:cell division protein FtsW